MGDSEVCMHCNGVLNYCTSLACKLVRCDKAGMQACRDMDIKTGTDLREQESVRGQRQKGLARGMYVGLQRGCGEG